MIGAAVRALGFGRETAPAPVEHGAVSIVAMDPGIVRDLVAALVSRLPLGVRESRATLRSAIRSDLYRAGAVGITEMRLAAVHAGRDGDRAAMVRAILAELGAAGELARTITGAIRLHPDVLVAEQRSQEREAEQAALTVAARAEAQRQHSARLREQAKAEDDARARLLHLRSHRPEPCGWRRCWTCASWPAEGISSAALAAHPLRRCETGCLICATWPALSEAA